MRVIIPTSRNNYENYNYRYNVSEVSGTGKLLNKYEMLSLPGIDRVL